MTQEPPPGPKPKPKLSNDAPEKPRADRSARSRSRLTLATELAGIVGAIATVATLIFALAYAGTDGDGAAQDSVAFLGEATGEVIRYRGYLEREHLGLGDATTDELSRTGARASKRARRPSTGVFS